MVSLGEDEEKNYEQFLQESIDTGCVWGLEGDQGWALCQSTLNDDYNVMPFWSMPEFAKAHCIGEWKNYVPVAVALEEFLDDWLTGMHQDILFVGVNLNDNMEGREVEPLDLLSEYEGL